VPPCILHRRFPFTAGDWHSVPERVWARQRGAECALCIGLSVDFSICVSLTPGLDVLCNDSLAAAIIDMDVPHDLFSPVGHAVQGLHGGAALSLCLERQPQEPFRCLEVIGEVEVRSA